MRILPIICVSTVLSACASTTAVVSEQADLSSSTRFIYVAAERKPCVGAFPMQCLQIREHKNGEWQHYYDEIDGFVPQTGKSYYLQVKELTIAHPAADASSKKWVLESILEEISVK